MQIKILKNRSDIGAGTRGSDLGIDAMEIAAIVMENHYFNDFPFEGMLLAERIPTIIAIFIIRQHAYFRHVASK